MTFTPHERSNRLEGFDGDDWAALSEDELRQRVLVLQAIADVFDTPGLRVRRFSGERVADLLRMTGYRGHRAWLEANDPEDDDEPPTPTLRLVEP